MDQRTFEQKVRELADKLKAQGVAISDSQARMMAESILKTEQAQSARFKEKQHDPSVNPQQRMPAKSAPQPTPPPSTSSPLASVDHSKPISELLAEANEPQEVAQPVVEEPVQAQPVPTSSLLGESPERANSVPVTDQMKPASPAEPEQKAPSEEVKAEEKKEEEPKSDQVKVDLTQMFNFSKR